MSKKINVNDMKIEALGDIKSRVEGIEGAAEYNLRQISLEQIEVNEKNQFGMREIDELAESLKQYGQLHNAVVRKIADDKYKLISGERRYKAAQKLGWKTLACKIVECDDVEEEILLITANLETRELNILEKSENANRLIELVKVQRNQGEDFNGKKTREVVAEKLNVGPATVQKLVGLKKLIPEFQDMIKDEEVPLEVANQYAQMDEESQKLVYKALKKGMELNAKTAKELKEQLKKNDEAHAEAVANMKKLIENADKQKIENERNQKIMEQKIRVEEAKVKHEREKLAEEKKEIEDKLKKLEESKNTGDITDKEIKSLREDLTKANKKLETKDQEMYERMEQIREDFERKAAMRTELETDVITGNAEIKAIAKVIERNLVSLQAKVAKFKNIELNEDVEKTLHSVVDMASKFTF